MGDSVRNDGLSLREVSLSKFMLRGGGLSTAGGARHNERMAKASRKPRADKTPQNSPGTLLAVVVAEL
jgi:hypothetical protein